jgi:murein DD-endopeptidase MepM/ murein hydrolase activator NlpD
MGDHINSDLFAVDYIGPAGSPVYPTLGGTVVFSGYVSDGYGNVVAVRTDELLRSGLYYYSIYAHLNDNGLPATGTLVTTTTVLGTLGSSGTDNVHLHFAVRASPKQYMGAQALYGQRLNPREIFTPAFNVREKLNLTPLCGN